MMILVPVAASASTTWLTQNKSYEFYKGKDYATNWKNNSSTNKKVYGEMYHTDGGVGNAGGRSGVWLARKGTAGTWKTVCNDDNYIRKDQGNVCSNSSGDNVNRSFDTHGKWNSLDYNWRSIKAKLV